jgi:hypothetical protein
LFVEAREWGEGELVSTSKGNEGENEAATTREGVFACEDVAEGVTVVVEVSVKQLVEKSR